MEDENLVMMEVGLTYRAWEDAESVQPKGWVAKTNSKVLNEKRKQIPWVRRRQPQHVAADGKIQRCRLKHRIKFVADQHVINNNADQAMKR